MATLSDRIDTWTDEPIDRHAVDRPTVCTGIYEKRNWYYSLQGHLTLSAWCSPQRPFRPSTSTQFSTWIPSGQGLRLTAL
jgi:hypothetical protein